MPKDRESIEVPITVCQLVIVGEIMRQRMPELTPVICLLAAEIDLVGLAGIAMVCGTLFTKNPVPARETVILVPNQFCSIARLLTEVIGLRLLKIKLSVGCRPTIVSREKFIDAVVGAAKSVARSKIPLPKLLLCPI